MFSIRFALESNGQVLNLNINRVEDGVVYCRLEDTGAPLPEGLPRSEPAAALGGQPEATQSLSLGAEAGEEAAQPDAAEAHQDATAPTPPEIGPSIMAAETAPKQRARAKATGTQRSRR